MKKFLASVAALALLLTSCSDRAEESAIPDGLCGAIAEFAAIDAELAAARAQVFDAVSVDWRYAAGRIRIYGGGDLRASSDSRGAVRSASRTLELFDMLAPTTPEAGAAVSALIAVADTECEGVALDPNGFSCSDLFSCPD
ncbi:MAG: hypothetical protein AAGA90_02745 [Actinomycetota bacterium]